MAWPPYFRELIVNAMASELSLPITDDLSKATFFNVKTYGGPREGGRGGFFGVAMSRNAANSTGRSIDDAVLLDARHGGVSGWPF